VSALSVAAVLALAASCQGVAAPETIAQIVQVESGRDPLAVHDNTAKRSYAPATADEARRLAAGLIAAGHSVDRGLAQINSSNDGWLGLQDPFDACQSVRAAANLLGYLSGYNTGSPTKGIAYAVSVTVRNHAAPSGPARAKPDGAPPDSRPARGTTALLPAAVYARPRPAREFVYLPQTKG
jgi:type IV secretion system protein VirB1